MSSVIDYLSTPVVNGAATGTPQISNVRLAMNGDYADSTMQDVADNDALAERQNVPTGVALYDQNLKEEDRAQQIEKNPAANKFAQDESNIPFLKEDSKGLMDTYNVLVDKNMIFGYDGKESDGKTEANFTPWGNDIGNASKRSNLQQQRSKLGVEAWKASIAGDQEKLGALRLQIEELNKSIADVKVDSSAAKAWEQFHRMLTNDIPEAAFMAGQGAIAGMGVGSAVPGVGTVAGGVAGATAGMFGGMFKAVQDSEVGNFYAEMLTMKDDAGNYVDANKATMGAYLYGVGSATLETGADAFFGKVASKALTPLKASMKSFAQGAAFKDGIKAIVKDSSIMKSFGSFGLGMAGTTLAESAQEGSQSLLSTAIKNSIKNTLREDGSNYFRNEAPIIGEEGWKEAWNDFTETMQIAPWFFLLPGSVRLTSELHLQAKAEQFAEGNKTLAKTLNTSKTKEVSPKRMESYLQAAGLTSEVTIPADALLELQRSGGVDITAMGWTEESLQEAAEMGQDVTASLAKLQSHLDAESMTKVADIMRESPESMSVVDAQSINDNFNNNVDDAIFQYERENGENNDIGVEAERIERELTDAFLSTPSVQAQIKSSADVNTTTGQYVRDIMRVIGQRAQRLSAISGLPVSQILKRYNFRGVADAMRLKEQLAEFGMDKAKKLVHIRKIVDPDLQAAWGKVSRQEFIDQFGPKDAQRIDDMYGPKFWAPTGKGVSPDKVAISAPEWHGDSRFGTRAPDEQVDMNEFWTGIMRTNEEVLGSNDVDAILQKYALDGDNIAQGATEGLLQAVESITVGEQRLENESMTFASELKRIFADPIKKRERVLAHTPTVLNLIMEGNVPQDGIIASAHSLAESTPKGKHPEMTKEIWAQIPKALANPVAIFDPSPDSNNFVSNTEKGDIVFLLELKDKNGEAKPFVAYISTKSKGNQGQDINMIKTCCSTTQSWIDAQFQKHNTPRYINEGHRWLGASDHIGHSDHASSKTSGGKNLLNANGNKIYTRKDFVKRLKKAKGKFFQSKGKGKARGATWIDRENGNYVIELFNGANLSTVLHELGHVFTLEMGEMVKYGLADEQMMRDWDTLNTWTDELHKEEVLKKEYNKYQKDSVYNGKAWEDLTEQEKWVDVLGRARNEWFARGFEKWLSEGVAPSSKLQSMFHRFAKWLKRVYQQALDLDVNINDDVRGVFNRMLAADEEMDIAAEQAGINDFTKKVLDDLGLRGAERMKLEGLIADAKAEAADKMRRVRDVKYEEQRKRWEREAQEEINKNPVYQVRKSIRQKDNRLDWDEVVSLYGEKVAHDLNKAVPGCVARGAGNSIEQTAAEYGFDSGLAMAKAITEAKNPEQYKKDYVDERQREHDATFNPDDQLFEQPEIAEMQEEIAVALQAKIEKILLKPKYKAEQAGKTVNGEQITPTQEQYEDFGNRANWIATREVLKQRAAEALGKMTMQAQIKPENFRKSATFWMQKERNAILRNDWGKAIEANYKARMNLEMARLATERQKMVQRLQKQSKQAMESKDVSGGIRLGVFILCQKFNIQPEYTQKAVRMITGKTLDDVLPAIRDLEDKGYLTAGTVDPDIFKNENSKPWQYMNWDEFSNVYESTIGLIKAERYRNYIDTFGEKMSVEEQCKEIADSILAENKHREPSGVKKIRNETKSYFKNMFYGGLTLDTILSLLDGDKFGVAWKAIMRPINAATWKRAEILEGMAKKWKELFSIYTPKEQAAMKQKFLLDVGGETIEMTRERAISILLNCGTETNRQRLIEMGFTENQLVAILNTLEEKDVKFAQSVWDYFDTFKKDAFDLEESMTGIRPKEVLATPVQTKFGVLRGGYIPIKYDGGSSVYVPGANEDEIGTITNNMIPASVQHGSMKDRREEKKAPGTGNDLKLELSVIPQHLAETAHMLAFRKVIRDVARILKNDNVAKAIQTTMGPEALNAMVGSLKYVAGQRPATSGWSRFFGAARKKMSLYTMGFSLCTGIVQTSGALTNFSQLGAKYTLKGIKMALEGRKQAYNDVCAKSAMMRHRMNSIDREMFEIANSMDLGTQIGASWLKRFDQLSEKYAFKIVGWAQMMTADMPTWLGAYSKAIEEMELSEKEAIEYADVMVERTQVGGAEKNLSRWQQGVEFTKIVTMYYSYFSCLYNLCARAGIMVGRERSAENIYKLATLSLPLFLEPVITGWATNKGPDSDDLEKKAKWALKEAMLNPFNMLPVVRDLASFVDNKSDYTFAAYRISPLQDVVESAWKMGNEIVKVLSDDKKASPKKATLATMKVAGMATGNGLLSAQANKVVDSFWGWMDGTYSIEEALANIIRKRKKEK